MGQPTSLGVLIFHGAMWIKRRMIMQVQPVVWRTNMPGQRCTLPSRPPTSSNHRSSRGDMMPTPYIVFNIATRIPGSIGKLASSTQTRRAAVNENRLDGRPLEYNPMSETLAPSQLAQAISWELLEDLSTSHDVEIASDGVTFALRVRSRRDGRTFTYSGPNPRVLIRRAHAGAPPDR